jgi:hypothetical protein
MKFITHLAVAALILFGIVHPAIAGGPPMVFSQNATISAENGELTIPEGQAWKIALLPRVFNCPVGKSCPAISIDGQFQVGDTGQTKNGPARISAEQLHNKPLWIYSGATLKVEIPNAIVAIQEYVTDYDGGDSAPVVQVQGNKPAMPILVTYRESLMGNGYVGVFTNQSGRLLAILVTAYNPSFGRKQSFRLDIPPNQSREIGHLEGWSFVSGDQIIVAHAEYAPINTKIP